MSDTEALMGSVKFKKSRKRLWITLGIIIIVVVALVGGFFYLHSKPSFCNAICHSPMNAYVNGYYGNDGKLLITAHADNGVSCLDCHEPALSEQLAEAGKWVTGNFNDPLEGRKFATPKFCLQEGCHNYDDVTKATGDYGGGENANPHSSHQGVMNCYECHSMHGTSTLFCNSCHSWELPEGWKNPDN
ncbi:MAG: cytochrome c3 family protein [Coriobacteriia bacterium]|nr:cytochrome c3 family protein [Coriobacteriia bacterium]